MQEKMVWKLLFILNFYFLKFPKLLVGSLNYVKLYFWSPDHGSLFQFILYI